MGLAPCFLCLPRLKRFKGSKGMYLHLRHPRERTTIVQPVYALLLGCHLSGIRCSGVAQQSTQYILLGHSAGGFLVRHAMLSGTTFVAGGRASEVIVLERWRRRQSSGAEGA